VSGYTGDATIKRRKSEAPNPKQKIQQPRSKNQNETRLSSNQQLGMGSRAGGGMRIKKEIEL
jgi:hypothetical protein